MAICTTTPRKPRNNNALRKRTLAPPPALLTSLPSSLHLSHRKSQTAFLVVNSVLVRIETVRRLAGSKSDGALEGKRSELLSLGGGLGVASGPMEKVGEGGVDGDCGGEAKLKGLKLATEYLQTTFCFERTEVINAV